MNHIPRNYKEALASPEAKFWLNAIKDELSAQIKNHTWTYVRKDKVSKNSKFVKIIDSRWVFTKKDLPDGSTKFKARLVIKGFQDTNNYDYSETYAPVAGLMEVHAFFALANKRNWDIFQMDVSMAFINSELSKKVLMKVPDGLEVSKEFRENHVCLVERALYGLRTSPKRWWLHFRDVMVKMGLQVYENQTCLFYWTRPARTHEQESQVTYVLLYVDDILATGNCKEKIRETRNRLDCIFEMKNIGEPKKFIGLEITRDRKRSILKLTQTKLIDSIILKFGLYGVRPVNTPF